MSKKFWNSLVIAAAVIIPTISAGALEALAQNSYGAIARSPSTQYKGYSWNYTTRAAAENRALQECESSSDAGDCEILMWTRNACMSLAEGSNGAAGAAWSTSSRQAESKARQVCRDYDGVDCRVTRTICLPK